MNWTDRKLEKYYTPEEIEQLKAKGEEFFESFKLQQGNILYKDANFLYQRTQLKQMEKATAKYPEPLNEEDWTAEELIDHAFQELVDQSHYLTALFLKIRKLEESNEKLKGSVKFWRSLALNKE